MEQPQEFDDPNSTISNILDRLRKFGVTIDFAPSKLKQGFGEQALFVLDRLSDEALRATQFTWSQPVPPEEESREDEEMEEDAEVFLDRVEEEMAGEYSDEEEEDILHIDDYSKIQNKVPDFLKKTNRIIIHNNNSRRGEEVERVTASVLDQKKFLRATQAWRSGNWRLRGLPPLSRSQSRMTPGTGGPTSSKCINTGIRIV